MSKFQFGGFRRHGTFMGTANPNHIGTQKSFPFCLKKFFSITATGLQVASGEKAKRTHEICPSDASVVLKIGVFHASF
jgi:hypothetical protein